MPVRRLLTESDPSETADTPISLSNVTIRDHKVHKSAVYALSSFSDKACKADFEASLLSLSTASIGRNWHGGVERRVG